MVNGSLTGLKRIAESPSWRIIIYLAGVIFAAGVFYASQRSADASQVAAVEQHTRQIGYNGEDIRRLTESQSNLHGDIQGLIDAIRVEHEARIREADRMDERVRYLERHR